MTSRPVRALVMGLLAASAALIVAAPGALSVDDRVTNVCFDEAGPEVCLLVVEPPDHLACVYVDGPQWCVPLADCMRVAGRYACYALFQPYCTLWLSAGFGGCFLD